MGCSGVCLMGVGNRQNHAGDRKSATPTIRIRRDGYINLLVFPITTATVVVSLILARYILLPRFCNLEGRENRLESVTFFVARERS